MKSTNIARHSPCASYYYTVTIVVIIVISATAIANGSPTATSPLSETTTESNSAVSPSNSGFDAAAPEYRDLENGTVLRFSTKPPLYDVRREGATFWYPCLAEVVRSANHISGLGQPEVPEVVTKWVVPEGVPSFNYSGKGEWPDLKGHGYFVIGTDSANHTLVLVHPELSDAGRYVCQGQLGNTRIHAKMELYVVSSKSYLTSTAYGFLATILFMGLLGLHWLLHRHVIHPYIMRKRIKEIGTTNIQQRYIEDDDQPALTDEAQNCLTEELRS